MTSSPNEKAPLPTYSESQALAGFPDDQQPTNVDEIQYPTNVNETQHEEDLRPLPAGWTRQWDSSTENYFYVSIPLSAPDFR